MNTNANSSYGRNRSYTIFTLVILFFLSLFNSYAIDNDSPQSILKKAFAKLKNTSFSCDFNDDVPFLRQMDAHSGIYYQLVAEDGFVYRKIVLFNSANDEIMVFTSNRAGFFFLPKWMLVSMP